MKLEHHQYLGDGVYASFDGYHIWLHLDRHDSRPLVALEPEVLAALNAYSRRLVLLSVPGERDTESASDEIPDAL